MRFNLLQILAAAGLSITTMAPAHAAVLEVIEVPSAFGSSNSSSEFTQTFTPTVSGVITSVKVGVSFPRPDLGAGALRIYDGIFNGVSGGTLVLDQPVTWLPGSFYVQTIILTSPLPVVAGTTYTLKPLNTQYWAACCSTDRYVGGEMYIHGSSYFSSSGNVADFVFTVVIESQAPVSTERMSWGQIKALFGRTDN